MNGRVLLGSIGLGLAAGMRAMTPFAGLSLARGRRSRLPLALGALELVGDKLPFVGHRTERPALLARVASGLLAGRVLARRRSAPTLLPMLFGAAAAYASTHVFHALRLGFTTRTSTLLPAFAEDTVALGLTRAALRWS